MILLSLESLPEMPVKIGFRSNFAMVFVSFFVVCNLGLFFFAERFAFLDTLDSLEIVLCLLPSVVIFALFSIAQASLALLSLIAKIRISFVYPSCIIRRG